MSLDRYDSLHSLESEQSVIGALLINPDAIHTIGALKPEHCYHECNREILAEIMAMAASGQPIDVITVATNISAKGLDVITGGLAYLGDLASNVPSARNVSRYAETVVGKAMERRLMAAANEINSIVLSAGTTREKLTKAQAEVMSITESVASKKPRSMTEVFSAALDMMEKRNNGETVAMATGYGDLDRQLSGGLRPGNLVIVAGRPGMGKTALSTNIGQNVAETGKKVLLLSMEMTELELFDRLVASYGRVPLQKVIEGDMSGEYGDGIIVGFNRCKDLPLWVDDQSALSLFDVGSKARSVKRQHGLDLLIVDYLQLMSGEGQNRNHEIEVISRGLKALAKELEIPVICLSQLSRKCEENANKRPMASHLRESGAIEQDADVIMMVYRDEIYDHDSPDKGTAEIIVVKNRQGSTGTVRLAYIGKFTRFESLDPNWSPERREQPAKKFKRGFE